MTLIGMGIQWLRYKKNRVIITKIDIQMKLDLYKHYHKLRSSGNKQWIKSKNTIVISTAINSGISAIRSIIENIFRGCNSIIEGFVTICIMIQYTGWWGLLTLGIFVILMTLGVVMMNKDYNFRKKNRKAISKKSISLRIMSKKLSTTNNSSIEKEIRETIIREKMNIIKINDDHNRTMSINYNLLNNLQRFLVMGNIALLLLKINNKQTFIMFNIITRSCHMIWGLFHSIKSTVSDVAEWGLLEDFLDEYGQAIMYKFEHGECEENMKSFRMITD